VAFALPVSSLSVFKVQPNLQLHRKIVVVDDAAGYTGSFNLVDPRFFKIFKNEPLFKDTAEDFIDEKNQRPPAELGV
jgi:cardiolipin synthase